MEKKTVVVVWDKEIFDGEIRLLPNSNKLYSQIYDVPKNGSSWSLVFEFEETPRIQGYKSNGTVHFLSNKAPVELLSDGFKFDFFDGAKKIGHCEIVDKNSNYSILEVVTRIELIEEEKSEFRSYINTLIKNNYKPDLEGDLRILFKYINEYPYLFQLILRENEGAAIEYLQKYFFKTPIESNAVYGSNLSFFIYQIKSILKEDQYNQFLSNIPESVKSHKIIQTALEEIN